MHALRFSTIKSAIFLSCSVMPASASITSTVMSLRTMDSYARWTLKNSTESSTCRVLRMPAVSIKIYFCRTPSVSTSNGTSMASRVVPGMGETMTRVRMGEGVDDGGLAHVGRPTMASLRGGRAGLAG